MANTIQTILLVIIFIALPFWLIYKMDKRSAQKGAFFTGPATRETRRLAIVLGVIFAVLFINELISSPTIHLLFPLLALTLIGYGLGAGQFLSKLQGQERNTSLSTEPPAPHEPVIAIPEQNENKSFFNNRMARLGKRITIILLGSFILVLGAMWVSNHPESSLSWLCIIGLIVFAGLAVISDWFEFFKTLFK